jgi:hypothetical protein
VENGFQFSQDGSAALVLVSMSSHFELKGGRSIRFGEIMPTLPYNANQSEIAEIIVEIERKNAIRAEAHLPLLDTAREINRALQKRETEWYAAFSREWGERVRPKALEEIRRWRGDPGWKPTGLMSGGIELDYVSRKILNRLYRRWQKNLRQ